MPAQFQHGAFMCSFDFPFNSASGVAALFDFPGSGATLDNVQTRFGIGQSLKNADHSGMNLGSNLGTLIDSVGVYEGSLPASGWSLIREWYDATAGQVQVSLQYNSLGALQFFQGAGTGTPLGAVSANGVIRAAQWAFLECEVVFATGTGGSVVAKVWGPGGNNGTPVINSSSLNTAPSGNAYCNRVYFENGAGGANTWFDDWYMLDTTGAGALATFLGNGRVQCDAASSDASPNQFSTQPSRGSGLHYQNVDELPLVNDSNYNFDNTVGDIEAYGFPANLPSTPLALNFWYRTWLDNSGPRTVEPICKSSGSSTTGSAVTPSTTPAYFNFLVQNDPNTGSPWASAAAAQAALFEFEIAS